MCVSASDQTHGESRKRNSVVFPERLLHVRGDAVGMVQWERLF